MAKRRLQTDDRLRKLSDLMASHGKHMDLHHHVVIARDGLGADPIDFASTLFWALAGKRYVGHTTIPLPDNAVEAHFFFGAQSHYDKFISRLRNVDTVLNYLPSSLVPPRLHTTSNPSLSNLIRWVRLLYFLALEKKHHTLRAEVSYSVPSSDPLNPEESRPLDEQLPSEELIRTLSEIPTTSQEFESWWATHLPSTFSPSTCPKFVNCYLTKELFYASSNAANLILSYPGSQPPQLPGKQRPLSERIKDQLLQLEALLTDHHKLFGDIPCSIPLSRDDIAEKLGWPGPRVSRRMKQLLGIGFVDYREKCPGGEIFEELRALSDDAPSERRTIGGVDVNQLSLEPNRRNVSLEEIDRRLDEEFAGRRPIAARANKTPAD